MIKLALNHKKPYNYAFFCPVSRLHLTVSNPSGLVDGVTPDILNGLKSGVLIDVDGVVDLATGSIVSQSEEPENVNNDATGVSNDTPKQQEEPKKKTASRRKTNKETE